MKNIKNKLILKRLVYVLGATIVLALIIAFTVIAHNETRIEEAQRQEIDMRIAEAQVEQEVPITTSRSAYEGRQAVEAEQITDVEIESEAEPEPEVDPRTKVHISQDMDLTVRTGLTKAEFVKLISELKYDTSGFFKENAETIYDLCEKYSINEIFFCGLISAESGWNIASNHRSTHNYISLMSNGKLIRYNSVNEGLEIAAQKLHNNYLTPGGSFYHGKTLAGVKTCFCPSSTWVGLVYGRMKQII